MKTIEAIEIKRQEILNEISSIRSMKRGITIEPQRAFKTPSHIPKQPYRQIRVKP